MFHFYWGCWYRENRFVASVRRLKTDVFFNTDGAVIKSAPTRTAARLNSGDTCHGAWALPFGSCLGRQGRIGEKALTKLQARLKDKVEASIDEISMLAPERFYQINERAKQGTGHSNKFMGGLKLRLNGDFMQLPPVNASSFASDGATNRRYV